MTPASDLTTSTVANLVTYQTEQVEKRLAKAQEGTDNEIFIFMCLHAKVITAYEAEGYTCTKFNGLGQEGWFIGWEQ